MMYVRVFFGLITIFVVIGYIGFLLNFAPVKVAKEGTLVWMEIVKMPGKRLTSKTKHFVHFRYNGRVFSKQVGSVFLSEYAVGQMVEMRYLEGETSVLFPNETGKVDYVMFILLGVFLLYVLIYGWVKMIRQ
jgi:hypothetical protein